MSRWPADNQSALLKFYGTPGPEVEAQLVPVTPPFQMYYEGKPVRDIKFHKKAAGALTAALKEIWDHYGHDQKKIDALGISKYAGAYNPRKIRGSTTKWSNHAYGAAIDLNAEDNGFGKGHGNIPQPVIDAFKRQGARWGGDYHGRTDPMHFEFCDNGQPAMATPVSFVDAPMVDGDSDMKDDTPVAETTTVVSVDAPPESQESQKQSSAEADAETRGSWIARKWRGITGTVSGFLGLGSVGIWDWKILAFITAALFFATVCIGIAMLWAMGPGDVRAWIRKQVS